MGSDYLFATSSFWSGVARVVDLSGSYDSYNTSADSVTADLLAARLDWLAVGHDLRKAMRDFKAVEQGQEPKGTE